MSKDDEKPIALIWDIENTGVTDEEAAVKIRETVQTVFPDNQITFQAFCAEEGIIKQKHKEMYKRKGVTVHNIPGAGKNIADYGMICHMLLYAVKNRNSELIMLLSGDNDFTIPMRTLKELRYKTVSVNRLKSAGKKLTKECPRIELEDLLAGETSGLLELKEKLPEAGINEEELPAVNRQKSAGSELSKVCPHIELKDLLAGETSSLLKLKEEKLPEIGMNEEELPTVLDLLSIKEEMLGDDELIVELNKEFPYVGMFIDLDTVQAMTTEYVVQLAAQYTNELKGTQTRLRAYGLRSNFPNGVVSEEYIETFRSKKFKWKSLELSMISGIYKFAIEYGNSSIMIVISSNPEIERACKLLSDEGFDIKLRTTLQDQLL